MIHVTACTAGYTVSGTVTTPANTPNIFVCIGDTANGIPKYNCGAFTNSSGAYSISFPKSLAGQTKLIIAMDILGGVTPNYISNPVQNITVTGDVSSENLAMQSALPDTTAIYGTLTNDLNAPITGSVFVLCSRCPDWQSKCPCF